MTVQTRFRNGVVIIDLRGRLTVDTASAFSDTVRRLGESGRRLLVLNLASVRYIDASGLGAITAACASCRVWGGDVKLLNLTEQNHHLFTITKLLTVMDAFDSEEEARGSFERSGEFIAVSCSSTGVALRA